ncbi:hypothetical protein [Maridesulfovibrio sp.]|uniref:hypothetical protein n=1 Tax=Maridesulfovibrio sp. TaxID=2795000 RepID=UPI0029CA6CE0|nr:hypothetical protein [Maridesulfovibrio sp.]
MFMGIFADDPVDGVDCHGLRGDFGGASRRGSNFGGGFYGASVGAIEVTGYKAFSDMLGIDKKDLDDLSGILGSAKPHINNKDFKK